MNVVQAIFCSKSLLVPFASPISRARFWCHAGMECEVQGHPQPETTISSSLSAASWSTVRRGEGAAIRTRGAPAVEAQRKCTECPTTTKCSWGTSPFDTNTRSLRMQFRGCPDSSDALPNSARTTAQSCGPCKLRSRWRGLKRFSLIQCCSQAKLRLEKVQEQQPKLPRRWSDSKWSFKMEPSTWPTSSWVWAGRAHVGPGIGAVRDEVQQEDHDVKGMRLFIEVGCGRFDQGRMTHSILQAGWWGSGDSRRRRGAAFGRTDDSAPFQYALSMRAGCKCLAHVQGIAELDRELTITSIDGISVFDLISCLLEVEGGGGRNRQDVPRFPFGIFLGRRRRDCAQDPLGWGGANRAMPWCPCCSQSGSTALWRPSTSGWTQESF